MDNDFIKVPPRIDIDERECETKKEGYVEAPGSEVPKTSIRKSSRLQIKKTSSSCSQDIIRSYHSSSKYAKKSSKASLQRDNFIYESKIQKENKHQFPTGNENNGVSADTAAMKSSTAVPSFRYHVQSKDGIQIVVDLNLKRSDWLKSMEKTVCVCQNHPKPEFKSFRQEVESLGDRNKSNNLKFGSPDKTNASDASLNSYVQNNFPLKSSREIGKTLPSVVEKEVITVSGSKRRWSNVDQNSEVVIEKCENTNMQENCSPNTDCRENVAVSCKDIKFSEFSSHQKDSPCSENLLTNTTEVDHEAGGNHKLSTVENGSEEEVLDTKMTIQSTDGVNNSVGGDNVNVEFLDDLDTMMEDIEDQLNIARMVTAVEQETNEKMMTKEFQLATLKRSTLDFKGYSSFEDVGVKHDKIKDSVTDEFKKLRKQIEGVRGCKIKRNGSCHEMVGLGGILKEECDLEKSVDKLEMMMNDMSKLVDTVFITSKTSFSERKLEHELKGEVEDTVKQSSVSGNQEEFQEAASQNINLTEKFSSISDLLNELEVLRKLLPSSDSGNLTSHGSLDVDNIHGNPLRNQLSSRWEENGKSNESKPDANDSFDIHSLSHERINFAKGKELSGREENALVTSATDDGPKRKKLDHNNNHINGESHERILRSTKMFGVQILERGGLFIRRSSRLFPK